MNPTSDSLVSTETEIKVKKVGVGITWKVGDNFYLNYNGQYLLIALNDTALKDPLISLEVMNLASVLWKFLTIRLYFDFIPP